MKLQKKYTMGYRSVSYSRTDSDKNDRFADRYSLLDYSSFGNSDLYVSIKKEKSQENNMFSKSEMMFFGNLRDLKKNYLKPLQKKEWT